VKVLKCECMGLKYPALIVLLETEFLLDDLKKECILWFILRHV